MSDLVGNPKNGFSCDAAHIDSRVNPYNFVTDIIFCFQH